MNVTNGEIERLAAEYIAEDWEPHSYYRDMNILAFARNLLEHGYEKGRKEEREEWEPVARQALAALNTCDGCDSYKGYSQWFAQEQVENAIKALCALICPVCLGAGWVEERPGEQCPCGLHSWEARK